MSEINGISNIEQKNHYNVKNTKRTSTTEFSSYLGESCKMDDIFQKAAQEYHVSVELLKAIGKAESGFDSKAVSRSGAQGVMQLMPATAASLGVTDSFDAEQNIMGGAKYISGLLKKYEGNTKLALAAYNAGSGNVAKYGGIPPFKETQNYVVKVTNYMKQGVNSVDSIIEESKSTASARPTITPLTTTTVPVASYNTNVISINLDDESNISQNFDRIFSYDDYMNLLSKMIEEDEQEESEDKANYYASKQINYNIPVLNLIHSTIE